MNETYAPKHAPEGFVPMEEQARMYDVAGLDPNASAADVRTQTGMTQMDMLQSGGLAKMKAEAIEFVGAQYDEAKAIDRRHNLQKSHDSFRQGVDTARQEIENARRQDERAVNTEEARIISDKVAPIAKGIAYREKINGLGERGIALNPDAYRATERKAVRTAQAQVAAELKADPEQQEAIRNEAAKRVQDRKVATAGQSAEATPEISPYQAVSKPEAEARAAEMARLLKNPAQSESSPKQPMVDAWYSAKAEEQAQAPAHPRLSMEETPLGKAWDAAMGEVYDEAQAYDTVRDKRLARTQIADNLSRTSGGSTAVETSSRRGPASREFFKKTVRNVLKKTTEFASSIASGDPESIQSGPSGLHRTREGIKRMMSSASTALTEMRANRAKKSEPETPAKEKRSRGNETLSNILDGKAADSAPMTPEEEQQDAERKHNRNSNALAVTGVVGALALMGGLTAVGVHSGDAMIHSDNDKTTRIVYKPTNQLAVENGIAISK